MSYKNDHGSLSWQIPVSLSRVAILPSKLTQSKFINYIINYTIIFLEKDIFFKLFWSKISLNEKSFTFASRICFFNAIMSYDEFRSQLLTTSSEWIHVKSTFDFSIVNFVPRVWNNWFETMIRLPLINIYRSLNYMRYLENLQLWWTALHFLASLIFLIYRAQIEKK